jgi:hypothetical protein
MSLSSVKTQWWQCPSCGAARDSPSIDIAERAVTSDGNGDAIIDLCKPVCVSLLILLEALSVISCYTTPRAFDLLVFFGRAARSRRSR